MSGAAKDAGSTITNSRSTFQNVLKGLRVPTSLQEGEGVDVLRVFANGQTQASVLSLSEDKFTLYLTSQRKNKLSNGLGGLFFGRSSANANGSEIAPVHRTDSHPSAYVSLGGHSDIERAIDIGAIDRIQRGHTTKRFELARYVRTHDRQTTTLRYRGEEGAGVRRLSHSHLYFFVILPPRLAPKIPTLNTQYATTVNQPT